MSRRLRGKCRTCKADVSTIWRDDDRVAVTHQSPGTHHTVQICRGSGRPAIMPVGV